MPRRHPGSGGGRRGCLLLVLARLGVGPHLVPDPGMRLVEQLGHGQQVVETEAVGLLPDIVALLVAAARVDAVPGAFLAAVPPDRDREVAEAYLVCRLVSHGYAPSRCVLGPTQGPYGTPEEPASAVSPCDGQSAG